MLNAIPGFRVCVGDFRVKIAIPLAMAMTVALAACADGPAIRSMPDNQIALSQVTLEPEAARRAINAYRVQNGLTPLEIDLQLTKAAKRHSADLSRNDRISHRGSDGTDPWNRVRDTGYKPRLAAENVGVGQRSFAEVLQGWKESPGHKKNLLLPDATQMGIALVVRPETRNKTFWTLVLGTPRNATIAARRSR